MEKKTLLYKPSPGWPPTSSRLWVNDIVIALCPLNCVSHPAQHLALGPSLSVCRVTKVSDYFRLVRRQGTPPFPLCHPRIRTNNTLFTDIKLSSNFVL